MSFKNKRPFVSVALFCWLAVIVITSVLMFSQSYSETTALVHTVVGFALLAFIVWHLVHNFRPLKHYLSSSFAKGATSTRVAVSGALVLSLGLLGLAVLKVPPLLAFHQWGSSLRIEGSAEQAENLQYRIVDRRSDGGQGWFEVEVKKGRAFHWPQYAIWLEDQSGSLVQAIYVTRSVANNSFNNSVWLKDAGKVLKHNPFDDKGFVFESLFSEKYDEAAGQQKLRPETLPVFLHKLKAYQAKHSGNDSALDGYTGATLFDSFVVKQPLAMKDNGASEASNSFNLYLEINQSFDFNDYYSSDRFPEDKIYSGDGFSAQPSVVYRAEIDLSEPRSDHFMSLVGHGHYSGKDGSVYQDVSKLTSALNILERIVVSYRRE